MQKTLIIIGAAMIAAGILWPFIAKLGLGRLPGDIAIRGENFSFYFPLTTMVIISIAATLIIRLLDR